MKRMTTLRLIAAGAAISFGVFTACFSDHSPIEPDLADCNLPIDGDVVGSTVVVVRDYEFVPASVTVAAGTRVTWVNCGPNEVHTSTADGGQWDSGSLAPGQVYTRTFGQAGDFAYHCTPHPFMEGTVVVQ